MPQLIPTPSTPADYRMTTSVGGVEIGLRLRWLPRARGWFVDVFDAAGNPLQVGRRVAAGTRLTSDATLPGLPAGALVWLGAGDVETQAALGVSAQLYYLSAAEVAGG